MRGRPAWFAVVVLVVVSGSAPAQQPSYTLLDLGVLSGSDATVSGISSGGRVGIVNERATGLRSFVWQSETALDIGTLGGTRTFAHGITFNTGSSATQVVGNSTLASGSTRAFLWTAGGTGGVAGNPEMRNLGTLGGAYSDALAVNATGRVTGFSENGSGRDRAFLWTSGTMSDLGAIIQSRIGLTWSYGYGINGLSRVVGYGYNDSFDAAVAWFYNGTTVRDLGDLGGGDAYPTAINDADQIVGYSATVDFFERAFVVTGTGVMRSLGTLGGQSSYALAVNNAGQVVGGSFVDPADSVYRAFVTVSGTMRDLNSYLDTSGQGWVLEEATGINSAGQIVGVAFAGGTTRAFLASPSAPLTWSISRHHPNHLDRHVQGGVRRFLGDGHGVWHAGHVRRPRVQGRLEHAHRRHAHAPVVGLRDRPGDFGVCHLHGVGRHHAGWNGRTLEVRFGHPRAPWNQHTDGSGDRPDRHAAARLHDGPRRRRRVHARGCDAQGEFAPAAGD